MRRYKSINLLRQLGDGRGWTDRMNLHDHLLLWNHASVRVMDIRYKRMEDGEELRAYRLPASVFLYATRGSAQVWLDGVPHTARRFHVFHGGKGLCLDITAKESFEYYTILYKAAASLPGKQEIVRIMDSGNPFQMQYGFAPHYPIALLDIVERMNKQWSSAGLLDKLQVKTLFYQFIYELMRQLDNQRVESSKPDPVGQAVRYMHQQYGQPITLESLAGMVDCMQYETASENVQKPPQYESDRLFDARSTCSGKGTAAPNGMYAEGDRGERRLLGQLLFQPRLQKI